MKIVSTMRPRKSQFSFFENALSGDTSECVCDDRVFRSVFLKMNTSGMSTAMLSNPMSENAVRGIWARARMSMPKSSRERLIANERSTDSKRESVGSCLRRNAERKSAPGTKKSPARVRRKVDCSINVFIFIGAVRARRLFARQSS